MSDRFRDRRVFAVVVVLFAATTWFNWTTSAAGNQPHQFTTVAMAENAQNK
jgi:hypothetical protein